MEEDFDRELRAGFRDCPEAPGTPQFPQSNPNIGGKPTTATARKAFDFLIGTRAVESMTDSGGKITPGTGEIYRSEKQLNGVLLVGNWHFNRGTAAQPEFVDAVYYSGFDNTRRMWSFYASSGHPRVGLEGFHAGLCRALLTQVSEFAEE